MTACCWAIDCCGIEDAGVGKPPQVPRSPGHYQNGSCLQGGKPAGSSYWTMPRISAVVLMGNIAIRAGAVQDAEKLQLDSRRQTDCSIRPIAGLDAVASFEK